MLKTSQRTAANTIIHIFLFLSYFFYIYYIIFFIKNQKSAASSMKGTEKRACRILPGIKGGGKPENRTQINLIRAPHL